VRQVGHLPRIRRNEVVRQKTRLNESSSCRFGSAGVVLSGTHTRQAECWRQPQET